MTPSISCRKIYALFIGARCAERVLVLVSWNREKWIGHIDFFHRFSAYNGVPSTSLALTPREKTRPAHNEFFLRRT